MSENTKEEAHAGSFGLRASFTTPGIGREELERLITHIAISIGDGVAQHGRTLIGHVKVFVSVPGGSLQVNMIDRDLGPEKRDRLPEGIIMSGDLRLMAAVIGLTDGQLGKVIEDSLGTIADKLQLEIQGHRHEH